MPPLEAPPVTGLIPSALLTGAGATRREVVLPYRPWPVQAVFHKLMETCSVRLYGGAMGGGKTMAICGEGISLLNRFPGNRIAYVRKTRTALKRTTLATFDRLLPRELVAIRDGQDLTRRLTNGSEALFLGVDVAKDPLLEDLKSLEVSIIYLEEASQLAEDVFPTAIQRKDRWTLPDGRVPPGGLALTTNPEIGWVKTTFYDPWARGELPAGMSFTPALPTDNPRLTKQYLRDMRAFLPPSQIARYLEGKWEAPDDPMALISYAWVRAGMDADPLEAHEVSQSWLAVDVAYEGDDSSQIVRVRHAKDGRWDVEAVLGLQKQDEVAVAEAVERAWLTGGTRDRVIVDANGIGSGVATFLSRRGLKVVRFKDGASQLRDRDGLSFRNLGDQAMWEVRVGLASGKGALPEDAQLAEELSMRRYRVDPGQKKVEVERKADFKRRLGRSPDKADAVKMGVIAPRMADAGMVRATVIR